MTNVKQWLSERKNKLLAAGTSALAIAGTTVSAFAEGTTSTDVVTGVTQVTNAITSQFNMSTISSIIGIVLAACVGLFLFWWGARKVLGMIMSAFRKGKLHL